MTLKEKLRKHHRDHWFIFGGIGLLGILLGTLYALLLQTRDLPWVLVTNKVLLFVLFYLNIVLILTILFVLARSLFKLFLQRRSRLLGSRFAVKLLATYVGLSLIPVLLLFLYGSELLETSIDRWFNAPTAQVLEEGSSIAQQMHRTLEGIALRDARQATVDLGPLASDDEPPGPELAAAMRRGLGALELDFLALYRAGEFVHGVLRPGGLTDLPEPRQSFLLQAAIDGEAIQWQEEGAELGRLVLAAVAVGESSPQAPVLLAGRLLEPATADAGKRLIRAYQSYRQLEVQRGEIEASQLLVFLMITLLILLASSWVGLFLARRVTAPIQALAEGTRRLSDGDLSHRVEVEADDELGVLVESFNGMADELQRNRALLVTGNRELREANERLADERALMVAVLDSVGSGVIAVDRSDRVFLCNDSALSLLRQAEDELLGQQLEKTWAGRERRELLKLVEQGDEPWKTRSEEVRLALGGEWRSFEVSVTPILEGEGVRRGRVIVIEDFTELIKAQKLAAWSEAARHVAHEIKNPLTPIRLAAERMLHNYRQQRPDLGSVLEEGVEVIVREVKTLKTLVDEFSRFARMPGPQPNQFDLGALIEETVRLYRGVKPGVEVRGSSADSACSAWADAEQLKGALINLLDNAVEATEAPGEVTVESSALEGHLRIRVADSGRGIPDVDKEKLFLPHFSTKGRGTGLGLAIVHRIVTDHHGTIRVEDNAPRGAVFTLELPLPRAS